MDQSQHNSLIRARQEVLSEGFKVTYNRFFEWDSDKAKKVYEEKDVKFSVVSSMLLSEYDYFHISEKMVGGEERFKAFGLANNGKYYICIYTIRKGKKRIISAWKAGSVNERKYKPELIGKHKSIEHLPLMEQDLLSERKEKIMKDDWPDYPTDQEYWEREMPDMKNLTRVMEGTMDQYLRQKKKLGEKKFFRILRKKYGSEDIGDGQKMHHYYPITTEDIRKYG